MTGSSSKDRDSKSHGINKKKLRNDSKLTADEWQRIDSIFQEVVELEEPNRTRRLRELTGEDIALQKEVESLLAFDDEGGEQLPAVRGRAGLLQPELPTHQIGSFIGPFRLLFPISINRASEVWCAEDPSANEQSSANPWHGDTDELGSNSQTGDPTRVAIKFLRDEVHSARRLQRFRSEAQFLARFRHPNIAQLIDCGTDEDGVPFIVTRYVVGTPITEFADEKNLNIAQRLSLMIRVCDAVSYAHRHLIVHRDLKPTNILVNTSGEPVILDFGISKSLDKETNSSNDLAVEKCESNSNYLATFKSIQLTATHERPMTPAYASPEQAMGHPVTTATDQYALGLILYELLTGHHPYSNESHSGGEQDASESKLLDRICDHNPLRPSEVVQRSASGLQAEKDVPQTPRLLAAIRGLSPQQLKRRLQGDLNEVAMQAIAKDPTERYASIADFRIDLDNAIHFRPVAARLGDDQFRNTVRRHPLKSVGLAAMCSVLACSLITALLFRQQANKASTTLNEANVRAEKAETRAVEATESLQGKESQLNRLAEADSQLRALTVHGRADATERTPNSQIATQAFLARQLADAGQYESAIVQLGTHRLGANETIGELPLPVRVDLATAHQWLGNPAKGLSFLSPINETLESLRGDDQQKCAYTALAIRLLLDAGRTAEATKIVDETHYDEFKSIDSQLTLARSRSVIGWQEGAKQLFDILQQRGRNFELSADQMLELFLLKSEDNERPESLERLVDKTPVRPFQLEARGRVLLGMAEKEDAQNIDRKAAAYERVLSNFTELPDHRLAFKTMLQLGQLYEDHNRITEAKTLRNRLWQRILATNEMQTMDAAWCGIALMRHAETVDQKQTLIQQLWTHEGVYSRNDYVLRQLLTHDFQIAIAEKDWGRADAALDRLCELEQKLWGEPSFEYTYALAAQVQVSYQLTKPTGTDEVARQREAKARKLVRSLLSATDPSPSRAFLQAAEVVPNDTDVDKAMHWWIHLFLMHRDNPDEEQLEMVRYIHREMVAKRTERPSTTKAIQILEAAMQR